LGGEKLRGGAKAARRTAPVGVCRRGRALGQSIVMMRAASTLAALITLGGVSVAEAQDASAGGSLASGVDGLLVGVLPRLPENWADLPFQLHLSESVGYNSNVLNTPNNLATVINGVPVVLKPTAAFESLSDFGASTKFNWYNQQFFADASFGMNRYLNHANFDTAHHNLDAGVNWTYTSRCSGRLVFSDVLAQSEPNQQIGFNAINSVTTVAFNETARCAITSNYSAVLNSGISSMTNSTAINALNNSQTTYVSAGVNYTVAATNSLELLATLTGTEFPNRSLAPGILGLSNNVLQDQINLTYTKAFDPNFSVIASIGLVASKNRSFSFDFPTDFLPIYSFSFDWSMTPKIRVNGSVAHVVTVPTSVLANSQLNESASLGLTYLWTPKVSLSATLSANRSSSNLAGQSQAALTAFGVFQSSRTYAATANLSYAMTPFLRATLSYQYYRTINSNFVTPSSLLLLGLNFNPY